MHIKICGIRTLDDALVALKAGADILGFNFYRPSPRYIDPEACAQIISELRARRVGFSSLPWEGRGDGEFISFVGVFVDTPPAQVRSILERCGLDLAQLCGDEPPEALAALQGRAYKAFRPQDPGHLAQLLDLYPITNGQDGKQPAALVDAYRPGEYGGTGERADWSLARTLCSQVPALLAGGLSPDNVAGAIRQVQPWGVDVASGVESTPGCKDPRKIHAFVKAVKEAF